MAPIYGWFHPQSHVSESGGQHRVFYIELDSRTDTSWPVEHLTTADVGWQISPDTGAVCRNLENDPTIDKSTSREGRQKLGNMISDRHQNRDIDLE